MSEEALMLSVQPIIGEIARRYAHAYSLCREELLQELQLSALQAIRIWDQEKSTLTSWVWSSISNRLRRKLQDPGFRNRYGLQSREPKDQAAKSLFSLRSLCFEVSDQAAQAIRLAVKEGVPDKRYVESILHNSLGWEYGRIKAVFQEVRDALS